MKKTLIYIGGTMKRAAIIVLSVLLVIVFLTTDQAIAQNACQSSGSKTTDGAIKAGAGYLCGATISPGDVSTTCVLTLYNSATTNTSGKELHAPIKTDAGSLKMVGLALPYTIRADAGIYADVTATGGTCTFNVHFR